MIPGRERLSYHEAGHAVVQTLLGRGRFDVAEVSIAPGSTCFDKNLRVQGHTLLAETEDLNLYEFGLATLAGIAAENRYFEEKPPTDEDRLWGAVGDIEEWECTCRRLYPDEGKAHLVGLNVMQKLQHIFDDPVVWKVVCELAAALVAGETLAGDELKGLLLGLSDIPFPGS
jgi:hypothetical protein